MRKTLFSFVLIFTLGLALHAQKSAVARDAFAHTYSIVAKDAKTGEMAVGVQSHWFSVGPLVAWGKSGVGVVATQSFVNPEFGPEGLALLEEGNSAEEVVETLINNDDGRDYRQLAVLALSGKNAAYTGKNCVEAASHITGDNFSVQANMMLNQEVVPAMAVAFTKSHDLPLAERVVKVLEAAQKAGGDIRGRQSAALIVVGKDKVEAPWKDKKLDLRVDDHKNPVQELSRLLKTARAYEYMNKGDLAMETGDINKALEAYGTAESMFPENLEMKFWKAVALANTKNIEKAKLIFKRIFEKDKNWRTMLRRLPKAGLLNISDEELKSLLE